MQVTTWATAAQVNPVPAMLTNDNPVGRVSTTVTGFAADGPLFVTVTMYVPFEPTAKSPVWVLVTARSAW